MRGWRWKNFTPRELSCRHCGEYYHHPRSLDALQRLRDILGRAVRINSATRCALHNAAIGGAPLSSHKWIAFDVSTRGHGRLAVLRAAERAGFLGVGFYGAAQFLHLDLGRRRRWFGSRGAREIWVPLLESRIPA